MISSHFSKTSCLAAPGINNNLTQTAERKRKERERERAREKEREREEREREFFVVLFCFMYILDNTRISLKNVRVNI